MTMVDLEVVDIRKMTGEGKIKARADVKIGGCFIARGFWVVDGQNGVFVSMPRRASKNGDWFDVVVPVNEAVKREVEEKVLEAYDRETDGVKG